MVLIKKAESTDELLGILTLQNKNNKRNLSDEEIANEGFVTLNHDIDTLQLMNSYEPQIIAVEDGVVVGYALVMVTELRDKILILKPMFEILNDISFGSNKLSESMYYIMGQVCIDKDYRGKGVFSRLYAKHKTEFASKYEYCITEVSESNSRSMKAHHKVGFENIFSFSDATDTWNILLLELGNKN